MDVFFVISGFLITSLIWRDLENSKFTFKNFWERRARRILPALVVVTLATLIAGWFLLLPPDYKNLGRAAVSQSIFAANFHYLYSAGYFESAAVEKPLLHTWSLSVEEQFYMVVPVFLWIMFLYLKIRDRKGVIAILATGFILSFALSIYGVSTYPRPLSSATFYLLPTRAWELLLGALIVFIPPSTLLRDNKPLRELIALVGLILILVPVFIYSEETHFPGLAALSPCLGAGLIIWANIRIDDKMPTLTGKILSISPIVFMGLISYSWYLWHWPILAFSYYHAITPLSLSFRTGLLIAGFICAVLSWKYVETPFRNRKLGSSRKSMFSYAGAGLFSLLGFGFLCMGMKGFPQRYPEELLNVYEAKSDRSFAVNLPVEDVLTGNTVKIGIDTPDLPLSLFVWGDSHAISALPAIDEILKEKGLAGRAATHYSTAPVLNWYNDSKYGQSEDAIGYNDAVFSYIQEKKIQVVILISVWSSYSNDVGEDGSSFDSLLLKTVEKLSSIGVQTYLLLDIPNHTFNVPNALSRSFVLKHDLTSLYAKPTNENRFDKIDPEVIEKIKRAGARIIDPKPRFLDPSGQHYMIQSDGVVLYQDAHHLSTKGAKLLLKPLLSEALDLSTGDAGRDEEKGESEK